jgi:hypothetical protein
MSSSIWTQSAGSSRIRRLTSEPRRIVEAQHRVSTRKLVDSDREQAILEQLLDSSKPPLPADAGGLHYLLSTPFRYPPLAHGSRFGPRWERGIWYGSESLQTALAEVAYYRLVFLEGTEAPLAPLETELTAFTVPVMARRGIDLSSRAFERWGDALTSKTTYAGTQPLGRAMRAAGVEAFRFVSARDPGGGTNIGVFTAAAEAPDLALGGDARGGGVFEARLLRAPVVQLSSRAVSRARCLAAPRDWIGIPKNALTSRFPCRRRV